MLRKNISDKRTQLHSIKAGFKAGLLTLNIGLKKNFHLKI